MMQVQYIPQENVICTIVEDDEAILLNLVTKHYYVLNETGTLIWECLEQRQPLTSIASTVAERYGISREQALQDVVEFLDMLTEEKLVLRRNGQHHQQMS